VRVYLFVKNNCPLCAPAKMLYTDLDIKLPSEVLPVLFNVDEDPGALAEFQYHGFMSTPTIAIVNEDTDEVYRSWMGEKTPTANEIINAVEDIADWLRLTAPKSLHENHPQENSPKPPLF